MKSLMTATAGASCAPSAVTPCVSINGAWTQTASAVISAGSTAILGPQPASGGAWARSGCGTRGAPHFRHAA